MVETFTEGKILPFHDRNELVRGPRPPDVAPASV